MSAQPQYMYDASGKKLGVFIPLEEYERLTGSATEVPVEQWEVDLIRQRMTEHRANPEAGTAWEEVRQQMIKEDGPF